MVRRPTFDALSDVVEACEAHGGSVQSVEAAMGDGDTAVELVVDHRLTPGDGGVFTPETASLSEDGRIEVGFRAPSLDSLLPSAVPVTAERTSAVAVTDSGALRCTHEFSLAGETDETATAEEPPTTTEDATEAVADGGRTADADGGATGPVEVDLAAVRDESVPPYEDTDYLRALYESCDTFEEMSRLIEMDVVAETVRRYMVDAGIHAPDSYDTDGVPEAEPADASPADTLVADGLGLPEEISAGDLVDAVVEATTVYEVTRALGIGQGRTRELLSRLGLLDKVMHRVTDGPHGLSREEVAQHIRRQHPA